MKQAARLLHIGERFTRVGEDAFFAYDRREACKQIHRAFPTIYKDRALGFNLLLRSRA